MLLGHFFVIFLGLGVGFEHEAHLAAVVELLVFPLRPGVPLHDLKRRHLYVFIDAFAILQNQSDLLLLVEIGHLTNGVGQNGELLAQIVVLRKGAEFTDLVELFGEVGAFDVVLVGALDPDAELAFGGVELVGVHRAVEREPFTHLPPHALCVDDVVQFDLQRDEPVDQLRLLLDHGVI